MDGKKKKDRLKQKCYKTDKRLNKRKGKSIEK